MTYGRPLRVGLLVGVLAVAGTLGLLTVPRAAANWSGTVYHVPGTLYVGEYETITYTFTSTGTGGSMNIYYFRVSFDWMSGTYYDLGGSNAIPDGGSATFYLSLTVPNSVGSHGQTITVNGQETGDWFDSTTTYTGTMSIANRPPLTVSIQANPSYGKAPLAVSFTSTVSGGTPGYTYQWSFGDGGTSSAANPSETYGQAGTFTVSLIVVDGMSRSESATTTVTVTAPNDGGGGGGGGATGGMEWIIILLVVVVLIVAVAIGLSRWRNAQRLQRSEAPADRQTYQPPSRPPFQPPLQP